MRKDFHKLILARKLDEKIVLYLNDQMILEIAVTEIARSTVRLAFVAPLDVKIWREEADPHNKPQTGDAA